VSDGWIATLHGGTSVDGCGDVDGDGVDDLVVGIGHPIESAHAGEVAVYSGATGEMILNVVEEDLLR
jgi:hypothetical protein